MITDQPSCENRYRLDVKTLVVLVLIFLAVVALRSVLVTGCVVVHNDERHYALDGFWVKSGLSLPTIWNILLRGHVYPHVFYHPKNEQVKPHGDFARGFNRKKDDLATFPRAGHPPLYMTVLGGVFLFLPKTWLLDAEHYILVARVVNTFLDCLTWLLLFQILRELVGGKIALWATIPAALLPYSLIVGSIGYLDSPGTFMIVLCAWVYVMRIRTRTSIGWWVLLGLLLGAGILMKQSNVFAFPLLAGAALIWQPARRARELLLPLILLLAMAGGTVLGGCNPTDLVSDTMTSVSLTREFDANRFVAKNGFLRLKYLAYPARHYHFGTTKKRPTPITRSPFLVGAHYFTFPVVLVCFALAVIILAGLRRWLALVLPLFIGLIAFYIPFGSCVRRLHFLLPFVVLTIALAIFVLVERGRILRSGTVAG